MKNKQVLLWLIFSLLVAILGGIIATNNLPKHKLSINISPANWASKTLPGDCAHYIGVAKNFALGRGVVGDEGGPFIFWGPGTPVVQGIFLWIFGTDSMWGLVVMLTLFLFLSAILSSLIVWDWTHSKVSVVLAIIFSVFCLPLLKHVSGPYLTSSETVTMPFLMLFYFQLSRLQLSLLQRQKIKKSSFFFLGFNLGILSLVRDSFSGFALFMAGSFLLWGFISKFRKFREVFVAVCIFVLGVQAVRLPVKAWNKERAGLWAVSSSSAGAVWWGVWAEPNTSGWIYEGGIGVGSFLDPETGKYMREKFRQGTGVSLSFRKFLGLIFKKPVEFLSYKAKRLPVLWLGAGMWPNLRKNFFFYFNFGVLTLFFTYLFLIRKGGLGRIPLFLVVYWVFLSLASLLIHFEFRYSFPAWQAWYLTPGLLWAAIINGVGKKDESRKGGIKL